MFWKQRGKPSKRDIETEEKLAASQRQLLEAATSTANVAHDVTIMLQSQLNDSAKRFEVTARIMRDSLILCGTDGTIQYINQVGMDTFGQNILGTSVLSLFDGDVQDIKSLWSLIEDETCWLPQSARPLRGIRHDHSLFWIEPKVERLDWHNRTSSMMLLIRDASQLVRVKHDNDDLTTRYRSIFEASFDGILVTQGDLIVAANPSIQRLYGFTCDELLDRPISTLFAPENIDHILNPPSRRHQVVRGIHESGMQLSLILSSANIIWEGQESRLMTVKDLTDMRRLEELASHKRDNGVDMVVCFDQKFRITFANQSFARQYNCTRTELVSKDIRDLFTTEELCAFNNHLQTLSVAQPSGRMQVQHTDMFGQKRVTDWIDTLIVDSQGNPLEYQRVGRDISSVVENLITKS